MAKDELRVGAEVRVKGGSFAGREGVVNGINADDRHVVFPGDSKTEARLWFPVDNLERVAR